MNVNTLGHILSMIETDRFAYLVGGLLKLRTAAELSNLSRTHVLALSIIDWLAHLGFDPSQQERIYAFLPKELGAVTSLVICDGRYVVYHLPATMARARQIYDLHTDELLEKLPQPAVTHFVCAVQELYKRVVAAAREIEGEAEDDDEATNGSAVPAT